MKKEKNSPKNKLVICLALMFLFLIILVSYSYAWPIGSPKTEKNIISTGNIDVEINYAKVDAVRSEDGKIAEESWYEIDEKVSIFSPIESKLWTPGHTEIAFIQIKNDSNVSVRFDFKIETYDQKNTDSYSKKQKLSDFLILNQKMGTSMLSRSEYWIVDETSTPNIDEELEEIGKLRTSSINVILEPNESSEFTLAVYLPKKIGNTINKLIEDIEKTSSAGFFLGINVTVKPI